MNLVWCNAAGSSEDGTVRDVLRKSLAHMAHTVQASLEELPSLGRSVVAWPFTLVGLLVPLAPLMMKGARVASLRAEAG